MHSSLHYLKTAYYTVNEDYGTNIPQRRQPTEVWEAGERSDLFVYFNSIKKKIMHNNTYQN